MSLVVLAAVSGGCGGLDARLEMHREQLESLGSTTTLVGDAWLGGRISGTYARTALEQSYFLVERERAALAASPEALLDPRGAGLSQAAEQLSRLLAALMHDVEAADGASVRRRLQAVPLAKSEPR